MGKVVTLSRWSIISLVTVLAACGFHLRGAVQIPPAMERTYLSGTPREGELAAEIEGVLTGSGGDLVDRLETASAELVIQNEDFDRRVLSVDSRGKVSEYELIYRLGFLLRGSDGEVLAPARDIKIFRSFAFDPENVLGAGDEEAALRKQMRSDAVRQMFTILRMRNEGRN